MTKKIVHVKITGSEERPIIRIPWPKDDEAGGASYLHIVFEHPEHPLLVTLPMLEMPDGFLGCKGRRLSLLGAVYQLLEATDNEAIGVGKSQPLNATFDLED